jgi:hypothetical protein
MIRRWLGIPIVALAVALAGCGSGNEQPSAREVRKEQLAKRERRLLKQAQIRCMKEVAAESPDAHPSWPPACEKAEAIERVRFGR